ncbi:acyltransferase [Roseivirga sp.]|uniref:acyltransferase n=1 Tax=Roseivirga sp. TaxID=1964215 RepID=UPI003B8BDC7C
MKLIYKSTLYKVIAVLRFYALKVFYLNKLSAPITSMIGRKCGIYIQTNGRITCNGRFIINDHVIVQAKGLITIGKDLGINSYTRIVAHERITIGDNVTIGQMVAILDHDHNFFMQDGDLKLDGYQTAPINIGNNVWIGDKCTILRGVNIGNNVVIGANSLIHKDVPNNCVVGGVPFKLLKEL